MPLVAPLAGGGARRARARRARRPRRLQEREGLELGRAGKHVERHELADPVPRLAPDRRIHGDAARVAEHVEHASRPAARGREQHRRRGAAVRRVEHEHLFRGRRVRGEELLQRRPGDARLAELGGGRPRAHPLRVEARAGRGIGRSLDADDRGEAAAERQREEPVAAVEVPEAAAAAEHPPRLGEDRRDDGSVHLRKDAGPKDVIRPAESRGEPVGPEETLQGDGPGRSRLEVVVRARGVHEQPGAAHREPCGCRLLPDAREAGDDPLVGTGRVKDHRVSLDRRAEDDPREARGGPAERRLAQRRGQVTEEARVGFGLEGRRREPPARRVVAVDRERDPASAQEHPALGRRAIAPRYGRRPHRLRLERKPHLPQKRGQRHLLELQLPRVGEAGERLEVMPRPGRQPAARGLFSQYVGERGQRCVVCQRLHSICPSGRPQGEAGRARSRAGAAARAVLCSPRRERRHPRRGRRRRRGPAGVRLPPRAPLQQRPRVAAAAVDRREAHLHAAQPDPRPLRLPAAARPAQRQRLRPRRGLRGPCLQQVLWLAHRVLRLLRVRRRRGRSGRSARRSRMLARRGRHGPGARAHQPDLRVLGLSAARLREPAGVPRPVQPALLQRSCDLARLREGQGPPRVRGRRPPRLPHPGALRALSRPHAQPAPPLLRAHDRPAPDRLGGRAHLAHHQRGGAQQLGLRPAGPIGARVDAPQAQAAREPGRHLDGRGLGRPGRIRPRLSRPQRDPRPHRAAGSSRSAS